MQFLRTNTAVIVTVGPFYDKTDGVTIETGLTITDERITLTADTDAGSAPTNVLDNVTGATSGTDNDLNYITGNDAGMMQLELSAANTNRLGRMLLSITDAANHVPVFHEYMVLPAMIYDAFVLGTDTLDASVTEWLGTAVATPTTAGIPEVDVTHFAGTVAATPTVAGIPKAEASLTGDSADDIADALIAAFGLSGAAASSAVGLASSDVDVANQALDLLKEAPITAFTDDTPEARWMARNYSTSRNAELREHPWKFALKRKTIYPSDFVLDGITATLTGAWAPFRLREKWSGDLIKIRRSSDSTTDTFGLATTTDENGATVWDDPILLDTASVETFVGSGSGYFDTIYDQSGNGNDISQATTTKQPLYDAELGDNDVPAVVFDGSNDVLSTAVAVSSLMSTATGYIILAGLVDALTLDSGTSTSNHLLIGDASKKLGLYVRKGGTLYAINDDGSLDAATDAAPMLVPFVVEIRHESGTLYTRVNGGDWESATSGTTSSLAGVLNIGDLTAGSQALDFSMFAAMTFSSIPSEAERDRMVSRLMRWCAAPGAKDFGWSYRYPVPSDCLRMLPITQDGKFEGRIVPHAIEANYVLTNQSTSLDIRYISQFTDASRFDPLFVEALAARIASKGAHWFTGKISMLAAVAAAYNTAIEKARRANALEATPERPADEDVLDQRYDAEGVR